MAIVIATTTVTIKGNRPQLDIDPDDEGLTVLPEVLATGVRASITLPATARRVDNIDQVDEYAFRCDPVDVGLTRFDTVIDESTNTEYEVRTVAESLPTLFGFEHITGRVRARKGLTSSEPSSS